MECRNRKLVNHSRHRRGFSLVELVLVILIIGIIGAIAVPRVSRSGRRAAVAAVKANVSNVRKAIECYYAEHRAYPGYASGGGADNAMFIEQLTKYSDAKGNTSDTRGGQFVYGPYLRPPFPANPINGLSNVQVKTNPGDANPALSAAGWVAVLSTGKFRVNASTEQLVDRGGKAEEVADMLNKAVGDVQTIITGMGG